tara:strand:- start:67687 stop:69171 length:1485 start_codon:yes stop_codon:yes gene_type:complete
MNKIETDSALSNLLSTNQPNIDKIFVIIADYIFNYQVKSDLAIKTAGYVLLDSFACAFEALEHKKCTKLLGPYFSGITVNQGARVIGTNFILDPFKATFDTGVLIRWLDYNDTWLAKEWGHPSDNLAGILVIADYINRNNLTNQLITIKDILNLLVKAYEIQGIIALENSFNSVGIDHVILVKLATSAIVTKMLGGNFEQVVNVISQVWADGNSLRLYRHAPNTGSRKSWAAGDAAKRAIELSWLTLKGEQGYLSSFSAPKWGFSDVIFKSQELILNKKFSSYVMENILFKISYPAEFHAQTAAEAAITLYHKMENLNNNINDISKIEIYTQKPAIDIISKTGPLYNFADRDHCLQYIVAIGLIYGKLTASHYEDSIANNKKIDDLRSLMEVSEDKNYTKDYYDLNKRAISNAIKIYFKDGSFIEKEEVKYPLGHRNRREEGVKKLIDKFNNSLGLVFDDNNITKIKELDLQNNFDNVYNMPVNHFIDYFVKTE